MHLARQGLPPDLAKNLAKEIVEGSDFTQSEWYPQIFNLFEELGIELKDFRTMPMHLVSLGIEKNLITKTPMLCNRKDTDQNAFWKSLTISMQSSQKAINSISIDWCMSMSFSGKDKNHIGTAGWQSDHYLAFTRLSLFQFAPIDEEVQKQRADSPLKNLQVLLAFRHIRVLWFYLVSRLLSDIRVSSDSIDNYVKLCLSSCRRFDQVAKNELKMANTSCDDADQSEDAKPKKKRKTTNAKPTKKRKTTNTDSSCDDADQSEDAKHQKKRKTTNAKPTEKRKTTNTDPSKKTKSKKKAKPKKKGEANTDESKKKTKPKKKGEAKTDPFFVSTSNYPSLLNFADMIDYCGDMRGLWESIHESYIQEVKKEVNGMRHTVKFLATVLRKIISTAVFSLLNADNPHNNFDSYDRTIDLKIYKYTKYQRPENLLNDDVVVGLIDDNEQLHICVDLGKKGIELHELAFNDSRGNWCYNLWYSEVSVCEGTKIVCNRKELNKTCSDFFILLRRKFHNKDYDLYTIITKSWRIRDNEGMLQLPVPRKEVLSYAGYDQK